MTALSTNQSLARLIRAAPFTPDDDDGKRAAHALDAFLVTACETVPEFDRLVSTDAVRRLLLGIFHGSPYLSALITRDSRRLAVCLSREPEALLVEWQRTVVSDMAEAHATDDAKRILRQYKARIALLTALADLGGVWPVMKVTEVLTQTADLCVDEGLRFLFRVACRDGQWTSDDPTAAHRDSGLFVLAMGKQGAFELNYSSDIDLIVFFNRKKSAYSGKHDLQSFFVRLTRDLVALLEDRTADGYVFRTDLRLRPDAGATQIALSTTAAFDYYETVGQNWERAAMIKARPCAGDIAEGERFLAELSPFVWRKYLDFAQIADVHAMKRQIHSHQGIGEIDVPGQNVKLGRGGIREIEFFVQTQQLIAGGRQIDLRLRPTLAALHALEARGWVSADIRGDLEAAYLFLREIEHRLQMVNDEQTHELPKEQCALMRFAHFAGYASIDAMGDDLRHWLGRVEDHYGELFEDAPSLSGPAGNLVFAGADDDPKTRAVLSELGFSQPSQVLAIVRGWHHGRAQAVRTPRARELLTEVQPLLIAALADTVDPDGAIAEFDRFLAKLPASVQLFSLLKAHPALIRLLADIMGSTPRLAGILSKRRRLLDAVLDPAGGAGGVTAAGVDRALQKSFAEARQRAGAFDPMQDILDGARVIGSEFQFLIGVEILTGRISAADAGVAYATVAERLVAGLLDEVTRQMEAESGVVPGGAAAVVAMGKLGGREMTAASDIDLILLYDYEVDATASEGARPLAPSQYYIRLTQRLINAISALTAQGRLYEVDMRLRPSGQQGPLATRLASFITYQENEAWTWEHMALTRARVIAGDAGLAQRATAAIHDVLVRPRDSEIVKRDVAEMRARIGAAKGTDDLWDLKQTRGGLVDLEFIVQYLQLAHAAAHPGILETRTLVALAEMEKAGVLSPEIAARLRAAGGLLHDLMQVLRLSLDGPFNRETAPRGLKALLARAAGCTSFADLEAELRAATASIKGVFDDLVGGPAE